MPSKKVKKAVKVGGKVSKSVAKKVKVQAEAVVPAVKVPVNVPLNVPIAGIDPKPISFENVLFEGAKVLAILPSKHTLTHFHCKMSSGETKHVPKSLFE